MGSRDPRYRGESRSAGRVLDILDVFFDHQDELTLTDISARLGLPKSSAHAILQAMRRRGYLAWSPARKTYSIGLRVAALARASSVVSALQAHGRPYLERLGKRLRETVMLGVYEADAAVCVDRVVSPDRVYYTVAIGERGPLHATSLGKVYLASLEADEVRQLLGSIGMERITDRTIVDVEELLDELDEVRKNGFARNRSESIPGLYTFGVPIHGGGDRPIAGFTVMGPAERVQQNEEAIVTELLTAARQLSHELSGV